ncbi:XRE family transcriptional regulator [bacterium D16-51]|nr:XRE family transcriptional regulator [bacterium D16-59]RKI54413.1 XRE family transcriptional regulator [bacterium D16-51]
MKREQLIKTRKSLGLTQANMADAVGVHRSYYGLIENGNRNPTLGIASRIAIALDSNVEQLFPDEIFFANRCYEMKRDEQTL